MRRLSFVTCFVLLAAHCVAQTPLHDVLRSYDKQRFTAQIQKDSVALSRLLSDELIYTHSNGLAETKQQFIHSLMSGRWNYQAIDTDSVRVRFFGSSLAILTGRARVTLLTAGKPTLVLMAYTDVWHLQLSRRASNPSTGRWQLVSWAASRLPVE